MLRVLAVGLTLTLLLAGCAGAPEEGSDDLELQDVEVTETTGAVSGIVIDVTIRPIVEATVVMEALGLETTTNEQGQFAFQDLGPGLYNVRITAEGFLPATYTTEVVVGEVAKMRVTLEKDFKPTPYTETIPLRGYADASVGLASYWVDYVIDAAEMTDEAGVCQCFFRYSIGENLVASVMEVTWEENIANPAYESEYYWEVYADGNAFYVEGGYGANPINVVIPAESYEDVKEFKLWVYPDDVWPAVQQDFEIFITNFYHEGPAEGWSFVAGDA